MKKQKRYYDINEKVWVIPLKTTGIVKALDTIEHMAKVLVNGEIKEFPLHLLNKLRKPQTRPNFKQKPLKIKMGMNEIPVKIKLLNDEAKVPVYAKPGDSGFDLIAMKDVYIYPNATPEIVPTGLAVAVPEGFELQVRPRSGVSFKTYLRVANSPGTVDSGYRGEVGVIIENTAPFMDGRVQHVYTIDSKKERIDDFVPPMTYKIRKGDRIAQGVIAPVYRALFQVVDGLDETERGAGGFGSTGMNA